MWEWLVPIIVIVAILVIAGIYLCDVQLARVLERPCRRSME